MNLKQLISIAEKENFKEIEFLLDADMRKPVFPSLKNETNAKFRCMLDSGASIPVWCSGTELLKLTFPEAILKTNMKSILSGIAVAVFQ